MCEQARSHRAKLATAREEHKALAPLKEMAQVVERGVEAELATVTKRLAEVAEGGGADEAQKSGMEKRVQVLKKEDEAANAATYACELEKVHARVYHVPVHGRYL